MSELSLIFTIAKMNFMGWKKNPRIITAFVLAFVFFGLY